MLRVVHRGARARLRTAEGCGGVAVICSIVAEGQTHSPAAVLAVVLTAAVGIALARGRGELLMLLILIAHSLRRNNHGGRAISIYSFTAIVTAAVAVIAAGALDIMRDDVRDNVVIVAGAALLVAAGAEEVRVQLLGTAQEHLHPGAVPAEGAAAACAQAHPTTHTGSYCGGIGSRWAVGSLGLRGLAL